MLHLFMKLIATDLTQSPNLVSNSATANIPSPLILPKQQESDQPMAGFCFQKSPCAKMYCILRCYNAIMQSAKM
ncbi:hypothetical protein NIES73_06520 [Sphaerospermopsis kisseleviana NIES-73]|jgi:hypothetical protein|nr:hypothetical protein NIES73_06520 [Sphaerospermopsis kisseleviana NIES-73]